MLDRSEYFIREHVGVLKLTDTYDILDPQNQSQIGIAKEEIPAWAKYLRLLINKQLMPTTVNVYEKEGSPPLFTIHRPFALFFPKVTVSDGSGQVLGHFQSKFSLTISMHVFDASGAQVAELKGDWKGWDFQFLGKDGQELGRVTKKWAGIGKELFTSADNYMVVLSPHVAESKEMSALLLAAALAIDIIYKEKS